MDLFKNASGFDWDKGNRDKNFLKHRVTNEECEEVFFDPRKRIIRSELRIGREKRYLLMGRTGKGRSLFIVFIIRRNKIRVISARDLNRKERRFYEEKN
jgi:uncharacterized DUF497 family protein